MKARGHAAIGSGEARAKTERLLGRDALLHEIDVLLGAGHSVMLLGPPGAGKSALIAALPPRELVVIDPFERIGSHLAARVRRAMGRGMLHLVATRTLDRRALGSVRRIAFRFTVVRVAPLPGRWIARLIRRECAALALPSELLTEAWMRAVVRLAVGRPGMALAMAHAAASGYATNGVVPSPPVVYIEARLRTCGVPGLMRAASSPGSDVLGQLP